MLTNKFQATLHPLNTALNTYLTAIQIFCINELQYRTVLVQYSTEVCIFTASGYIHLHVLLQIEAGSRESLALVEDDCNIWDERSDSEQNIRFDKKKPGVVVGATFNKLVEKVTSVTDHGKY